MVDRDTEEWRRPWRDGAEGGLATRATSVADAAVTSRLDAVPSGTARVEGTGRAPAAWGDGDEGPGSPAGSVRPPDSTGTVDPPPRQSRRGRIAVPLVAALVGSAVGTGTTLAVTRDQGSAVRADVAVEADPVRAPAVQPPSDGGAAVPGEDAGTVVARVARAVLPSVVNIDVYAVQGGQREQIGVGSGVIFRSDGYLLTNNHVVEDADDIEVTFSDGRVLAADVVGTDRLTDLAVLLVEAEGLPAVNLREDRLEVGETAVAIGSPFGFDGSVTAGIVSALDRTLDVPPDPDQQGQPRGFVIPAVVQTDAAINPGNSGGALVDREGRLIGINTAILTRNGGSQGVGFAIPVSSVVDAAEQLIATGEVSHPFLGIAGLDVTRELIERYLEEYGIDLLGGAVVMEVVDGSAADVAGIELDDVIVAVGDEPTGSMEDVINRIRDFDADETTTIRVYREGEPLELDVTLGEREP